jgi:hypothetical protein
MKKFDKCPILGTKKKKRIAEAVRFFFLPSTLALQLTLFVPLFLSVCPDAFGSVSLREACVLSVKVSVSFQVLVPIAYFRYANHLIITLKPFI